MQISVVMPVYNESNKELKQSINSILGQTFTNFEFIIVDDNPKSKRIFKWLKYICKQDNRVRVIFNIKSIGPSLATNKGIILSHGKFIARMDADDVCNENRLKSQLGFIKKYNLDCICSNFIGFNDKYYDNNSYYGSKNLVNQVDIKKILSKINIAMGPTLFFRKNSFLKVRGYRNILAEDYDLVLRFLIHNYKVGYQASVLLYKRNRKNNLSNNKALDEFVITYALSKEIRSTKYKTIIPVRKLNYLINTISLYDKELFINFKENFNYFKKYNSLLYLIRSLFDTLRSVLVFKRNLWMLFVNKRNKNNI